MFNVFLQCVGLCFSVVNEEVCWFPVNSLHASFLCHVHSFLNSVPAPSRCRFSHWFDVPSCAYPASVAVCCVCYDFNRFLAGIQHSKFDAFRGEGAHFLSDFASYIDKVC